MNCNSLGTGQRRGTFIVATAAVNIHPVHADQLWLSFNYYIYCIIKWTHSLRSE